MDTISLLNEILYTICVFTFSCYYFAKIYGLIFGRKIVEGVPKAAKSLGQWLKSELTLENKPQTIKSKKWDGWIAITLFCMFVAYFWTLGAALLAQFALPLFGNWREIKPPGMKGLFHLMAVLFLAIIGKFYYVQAHKIRREVMTPSIV